MRSILLSCPGHFIECVQHSSNSSVVLSRPLCCCCLALFYFVRCSMCRCSIRFQRKNSRAARDFLFARLALPAMIEIPPWCACAQNSSLTPSSTGYFSRHDTRLTAMFSPRNVVLTVAFILCRQTSAFVARPALGLVSNSNKAVAAALPRVRAPTTRMSYAPQNVQEAWDNHFSAFGGKDVSFCRGRLIICGKNIKTSVYI